MAWYRTGAVSLTTGSNVVTGTGTDWKKNINGIGQGQALVANKTRVEIMYVDSDTQIRLAEPWSEPAYSGAYHIETAFAGTTGDSARQVMAALFLWKQMGVDWDEWLTSEAATVEVTNVFGEKVTIPTWKALSGASALMDVVAKIDPATKNVDWSGAHYMTGLVGAKSQGGAVALDVSTSTPSVVANGGGGGWRYFGLPATGGTFATQQWVNRSLSEEGDGSYIHDRKDIGRLYVTAEGSLYYAVKGVAKFLVSTGGTINTEADIVAVGNVSIWNTEKNARLAIATVGDRMYLSKFHGGAWRGETEIPDGGGVMATRQWIQSLTGIGGQSVLYKNVDLLYVANGCSVFKQGGGVDDNYFGTWGTGIHMNYADTHGMRLFVNGANAEVIANVRYLSGEMKWNTLWGQANTYIDGNGFIKHASPIVQIKHDGYSTNSESRGATVARLGVGEYKVCGVLGYNSDGAWGVSGGVSVPKDNNGLELIYVKDEITPDGSIIIRTYHRQHSHLPEMFQNIRKKRDGSFYIDGEVCDLPPYTKIGIRVQMPEASEYNQRQAAMSRYILWMGILDAMRKVLSDKTLCLPAPAGI